VPKTNSPHLKPFDEAQYLTDESAIAEYLNAAAEIGDPAVLLDAFAAVGRARGMTDLASKAGLGRESLYKALAPGAQPRYDTIFRVAQALGVGFHFAAPKAPAKRASKKSAAKKAFTAVVREEPAPQPRRGESRATAKS